MKHSVRSIDNFMIVAVSGEVDSRAAGPLYDLLVACTGKGAAKLIVDLSGVPAMTRAGVRGLVVAARLMKERRGELRICGAQGSVDAVLKGLGYRHLVKCDPTLQASIARLRDGGALPPAALADVTPHSHHVMHAVTDTAARRREA